MAAGPIGCEDKGRDRYGRSIGLCRAGGRDLGANMVPAGMAWAFTRYSADYVEHEKRAIDARRGVHARLREGLGLASQEEGRLAPPSFPLSDSAHMSRSDRWGPASAICEIVHYLRGVDRDTDLLRDGEDTRPTPVENRARLQAVRDQVGLLAGGRDDEQVATRLAAAGVQVGSVNLYA
jgi:hypothetical protein